VREDSTLLLTFDPHSDLVARVARHVCVAVFHEFECTPLGCIGVHFVPRAEYPYYVFVPPASSEATSIRMSQWHMVVDQGKRMNVALNGNSIDRSLVVPEVYTLRENVCLYRIVNAVAVRTRGWYSIWQNLRSTLLAICVIWRLEGYSEQAVRLEDAIVRLRALPAEVAILPVDVVFRSPYGIGDPFWKALRA
jgi:hypothetical protein